eukprot:m.241892 g.241892  ORF g.241892 m.241892 type:complete len:54 (-) comp54431_c3_seq13:1227-1388(-)
MHASSSLPPNTCPAALLPRHPSTCNSPPVLNRKVLLVATVVFFAAISWSLDPP